MYLSRLLMCFLCHKLNSCLKVKESNRPLNHISCLPSAKTFALVMLQLLLKQAVNASLISAHNIITPIKSGRQALCMGRWVLQGKGCFFLAHVKGYILFSSTGGAGTDEEPFSLGSRFFLNCFCDNHNLSVNRHSSQLLWSLQCWAPRSENIFWSIKRAVWICSSTIYKWTRQMVSSLNTLLYVHLKDQGKNVATSFSFIFPNFI